MSSFRRVKTRPRNYFKVLIDNDSQFHLGFDNDYQFHFHLDFDNDYQFHFLTYCNIFVLQCYRTSTKYKGALTYCNIEVSSRVFLKQKV